MSAERLTRPRHGTIADQMVEVLKASGVRRIYGLPGDSLNGLTDALRRDGEIAWVHVRHEEAAAFAAAGEAALTGELAVCAASCGPGQPAPDQRPVRRATAAACRCWRSPRTSRSEEIGSGYFQETHPQELFRECSVYCELVSVPEQMPRLLRDRDARRRCRAPRRRRRGRPGRGLPGTHAPTGPSRVADPARRTSVVRPADAGAGRGGRGAERGASA